MKKINYLFCCLFLSVAILTSCGSDDGGGGPTAEEAAVAKLQGSWEVTEAKRDTENLTEDYMDMVVVIDGKNISATGEPSTSVFPTGNFTFDGDNYNKILVDGINVALNVTDTNLTTSFALDEEGNDASSRVTVVQGSYRFTFAKSE